MIRFLLFFQVLKCDIDRMEYVREVIELDIEKFEISSRAVSTKGFYNFMFSLILNVKRFTMNDI